CELSALQPRAPPASPLFPYTTLFRSAPLPPCSGLSSAGHWSPQRSSAASTSLNARVRGCGMPKRRISAACADLLSSSAKAREPRSEEHTSELQSLAYLVCRLLLEKKK